MQSTTKIIKEKYGNTALSGLSSNLEGVQAVAQAFGYSAQELASIPAEANMGLSCGNPTATAHLKEGEVVVDLGCGGGLDVFLAANSVGPSGKAIGIDMTPQMLELARNNARKGGYRNVLFLEGQIDDLPLNDDIADVIISNCVINLAPNKSKVFAEVHRVLKPGGRIAISDIALKKDLPSELTTSVAALVGCIAGAIPISEYEQGLKQVGFSEVVIVDSGADLNSYAKLEGAAGCCSPSPSQVPNSSSCCSSQSTPVAPSTSSCCQPSPQGSSSCCSSDAGESSSCCSSGSADSSCGGSGCSDMSTCSCAVSLAPPDPNASVSRKPAYANQPSNSKPSAPSTPSSPTVKSSPKVSLVTFLPPLKNLDNALQLSSPCCSSSSPQTPPTSQAASAETLASDLARLAEKYDLNAYAASIKIYAVK